MNYNGRSEPCDDCPFLNTPNMRRAFTIRRLNEFCQGEFPCHQTAALSNDDEYVATKKSHYCAGALIFMEKRNQPNQMMRICERLGMYDRTKLDMEANIR